MIKINFNFDTKYGVFRDALHLPEDHQFSDEEIEAMKQERLTNWIDAVENPPVPEPEIVEIDSVQYEEVGVGGQIVLKPITNTETQSGE